MTTKDFTVIIGNTFDGLKFSLETYTEVDNKESLPLVGVTVYRTMDDLKYWQQIDGVYTEVLGPGTMDLTGAIPICRMKNPLAPVNTPTIVLKVGTGLFLENNSVGFTSQNKIAYPIGKYNYEIELTFPTGRVKTYIKGVMTVGGA